MIGASKSDVLKAAKKWAKEYAMEGWVDVKLLIDLAEDAASCSSGSATGNSVGVDSVFYDAFPLWNPHLVASRRLLPPATSSFLRTFLLELDRVDLTFRSEYRSLVSSLESFNTSVRQKLSSFKAEALQEEYAWCQETFSSLRRRIRVLSMFAHCHRVQFLWVLSLFASNFADVAALLVHLEMKSFWSESFKNPLLSLGDSLSVLVSWKACVSFGDQEHRKSSLGGGGGGDVDDKKSRKAQKKKSKKVLKACPYVPIPDSSPAAPVTFRVASRLTLWIRTSLAASAKADLLESCVRVDPEDESLNLRSFRVYLDTEQLARYTSMLRRMDPSNKSVSAAEAGNTSTSVFLEWSGLANVAVVNVVADDGSSHTREVISAKDAQEILSGKKKAPQVPKSYTPCVQVSSERSTFLHMKHSDVVITWDSEMVLSDVKNSAVRKKRPNMKSWSDESKGFLFPFEVVTITMYEGATIPKDLIRLFQSSLFIAAPNFDELCACVALLGKSSSTLQEPMWVETVRKAIQEDWMSALHPVNVGSVGSLSKSNKKEKSEESPPATRKSLEIKIEAPIPTSMSHEGIEEFELSEHSADEEAPLVTSPLSKRGRGGTETTAFKCWESVRSWIPCAKRKGMNLDDISEQPVKSSTRADPKAYWANERTLLSWMSLAIFMGISASTLLSTSVITHGNSFAHIAASTMAPVAIVIAIYSLVRFHIRQRAILGQTMKGVVDLWGPWIVVSLVCASLVVLTISSIL